jgi:ribonuclease Z
VVDTRPTPNIALLCRKADIAFLEGMFLAEHAAHAAAKAHMTAAEAARIAGAAGVKRAVLVHVSPRYDNGALGVLEAEAREVFENARVGRDLEIFAVPMPDA